VKCSQAVLKRSSCCARRATARSLTTDCALSAASQILDAKQKGTQENFVPRNKKHASYRATSSSTTTSDKHCGGWIARSSVTLFTAA
jgi:hypothetical protein